MDKYSQNYEVSSSNCDVNGRMRLRTLFNYFQDMADKHADIMGLGYHFCTRHHIGWIGGAYHVDIKRMPNWEEKITIFTWPSDSTAVTGIRDFQMTDEKGNALVNATSQWVLVDTAKMRPVPVTKHVGAYELIKEHVVFSEFKALPIPQHIDKEQFIPVRVDDIDINHHVNNAVYPSICLDGLDDAFLMSHHLTQVQVSFKKPAKRGDILMLKTQNDKEMTLHQILDETGKLEFARVVMKWNENVASD